MEDHCSPCWPAAPAEANWVQTGAAVYDESFLVPCPSHASASANYQVNGFPSWSLDSLPIQEASENKAASNSKSHSQAEKRRRDRINAQLGILRKLIPKSEKMDKAALLGSAIDHVKDLKQKATEISRTFTIPTEVDEVTVDCDVSQATNPSSTNKDKDSTFIRASVCCDDRPELFSELIRVLKGLRLTIVRADIASVGGRVKSILVLCNKCSKEGGVSISTIKQSLNLVLSRIASSSVPSNYRIRSKRQRFFLPSHLSQQYT
ncbi:hypothetical protein D5086_016006 [Populus alba]|uniref:Uncharacterized protein n=2 Tax=Populus alba TaxID=43335 RepID=A0ACC4BT35_POPAL|nr:transcription factor bHLH51-like [Populus alba]XP_034923728.1 transcription factor bHLH51-like [Populus alba]TKS07689.1 basic helix-loop-helix family protein [Populus alba]